MFEYYHLYFHSRNHFFRLASHYKIFRQLWQHLQVQGFFFFYYVIASLHPLGHLVSNLMESRSFSKQCKHIKVKICCVWKGQQMFLQVLVKVIVVYLILEPLDCIFFKYCIRHCIHSNMNVISASLQHVGFFGQLLQFQLRSTNILCGT